MRDGFDLILEAYILMIFLAISGLLLLSMALGFAPVDDWRSGLIVAGVGGAAGIIASWIWRDYRRGKL